MKTVPSMVIAVALIALSARSEGNALGFSSLRPQWAVGDTWFVKCRIMRQELFATPSTAKQHGPVKMTEALYQFRVVALADFAQERCYMLSVDPMALNGRPTATQWHYVLYFSEQRLRLVRKDRYEPSSNLKPANTRLFSEHPHFVADLSASLPLNWPDFSAIRIRKDDLEDVPTVEPVLSQTASDVSEEGGRINGATIVLSASWGERVRTTETWEAGKPWWTRAIQELNGRVVCECTLLTWDELWEEIRRTE